MLVLVGPLPPPINGQTLAFQMLVDGVQERGLAHAVVDLSAKRDDTGKPSWARALDYLLILYKYAGRVFFGRKTVYLTIAQSKHGFLRDCVMIWLANINGHKLVCHLHGGNYGEFYAAQPTWLQAVIRSTLRQVDRILVLGDNLTSMFDFDRQLADRIHVVSNGLPFDAELTQPKTIDSGGAIRVLFLSNLIESKGYLDLLEAVGILVKQNNLHVECRFYGTFMANPSDDVQVRSAEDGRTRFDRFVREHDLGAHAVYGGVLTGADKIAALRESHFVVLPTNYDNEGQPLSIIEAMAFGNVVVSTNYRAIPSMVVDGVTGCLVPYGQPTAIAGAIGSLVAEPSRYQALSEAAIEHFHTHFTRSVHLARILPLLV